MLLADVAETTVFLMLPVLLGAGLGSLLVAAVDTAGPTTDRSIRLVHTGFAVVLALDSVLLILYAMGEDTYYGGGVSRWEHAGRFVGSVPIAASISFAALTSVLLGASSMASGLERLRPLISLAAALSCLLLLLSWFWLTAGH